MPCAVLVAQVDAPALAIKKEKLFQNSQVLSHCACLPGPSSDSRACNVDRQFSLLCSLLTRKCLISTTDSLHNMLACQRNQSIHKFTNSWNQSIHQLRAPRSIIANRREVQAWGSEQAGRRPTSCRPR